MPLGEGVDGVGAALTDLEFTVLIVDRWLGKTQRPVAVFDVASG
jgi:hypothetical protein